VKRLYESVKRMIARSRFGVRSSDVKKLYEALVEEWETLPRGWTIGSLRQFWNTLTGGKKAGEGGVRACIAKMRRVYPEIDDPESFCASAADVLFPGWRQKAARERRRRKKKE